MNSIYPNNSKEIFAAFGFICFSLLCAYLLGMIVMHIYYALRKNLLKKMLCKHKWKVRCTWQNPHTDDDGLEIICKHCGKTKTIMIDGLSAYYEESPVD